MATPYVIERKWKITSNLFRLVVCLSKPLRHFLARAVQLKDSHGSLNVQFSSGIGLIPFTNLFIGGEVYKIVRLEASHFRSSTRGNMNQNMSATKTGYLLLASDPQQNRHVRLMAVAYTGVSDPFIVFYRDSAWIWKKPVAFLRLKSCAVTENNDGSFTLTPQGERIGSSTGLLCFTAETPEERQEWLKVLRDFDRENEKPVMKMKRKPRNVRMMPVIQESFSEELNVTEQRRSSLIPV